VVGTPVTAGHEVPTRLVAQRLQPACIPERTELRNKTNSKIFGKRRVISQTDIGLIRLFSFAMRIEQKKSRVTASMRRRNNAEETDQRNKGA
jgi:hypothetical protein